MTLQQLSSVYYLEKEIARLKEKIAELDTIAQKTTATLSTQPRGSGISDKVGEYGSAIVDLKNLLEQTQTERLREESKLYLYINTIPDALTRLIFQYRFIDLLPWNDVADKIGGNHNEKSVSIICYRYIKNNN